MSAESQRPDLRDTVVICRPSPACDGVATHTDSATAPVSPGLGASHLELLELGPGPFVFLSPHLDDVALSCAALVAELAQRAAVAVVTVFTEAGPEPYTQSARAFLRQCDARSGAELYAERRAEDALALSALGAVPVHLGFADALFRRKTNSRTPRGIPRRPAILHSAYPTYRWHIKRGVVGRGDEATVAAVTSAVHEAIADLAPATVLAPMGTGRHVDHRIVAMVAEEQLPGVVYYADLPYALTEAPDAGLVHRQRLVGMAWSHGIAAKPTHLSHYRTQMAALFPDGQPPTLPECYFACADQIRCG